MLHLSSRIGQQSLEEACIRSIQLCNANGIFNLPCRNENTIDVSKTGEYLLCADRACFCIINIDSQLHNDKNIRGHDEECKPCSCCRKSKRNLSPAPCDTLLTKGLSYKTRCAAALWFPVDDSNMVSAGDNVVDIWDLKVPQISYTFTTKLSEVKKVAVSSGLSRTPIIAAGLKCGSISTCDSRNGTVSNYINGFLNTEVTTVSFQVHDDNLLVAGYEDSTVAIWDLRRYTKPLRVLSTDRHTGGRHTLNGCSVSYIGGYELHRTAELPLAQFQDFSNEDAVWSYVMDHGKAKTAKAANEARVPTNDGTERATQSIFELSQGKRAPSTVSITDLLMGSPKNGTSASSSSGRKRNEGGKTGLSIADRDYILRAKKRRLYSGPDAEVIPIPTNHRFSATASRKARPLTNASQNVASKERGIPTSVNCSKDGNALFVARHKGYIEQYDARNHRYIADVAVDGLLPHNMNHERHGYGRYMKLVSWYDGDYIFFNAQQRVGIYDTRHRSLCGLFQMEWENHSKLVNAPSSQRDPRTTKNYITDIKALPSKHEIYAINEAGELFILHPDKCGILGRGPTGDMKTISPGDQDIH